MCFLNTVLFLPYVFYGFLTRLSTLVTSGLCLLSTCMCWTSIE